MFGKFGQKLSNIFTGKKLDNNTLEELEELLITYDISYDIVCDLIEKIKSQRFNKETNEKDVKNILKDELYKILSPCEKKLEIKDTKPFSIIMIGVNGSGKTTTIGKLAYKFASMGKQVSVIACDTFRISATEQLKEWTEKSNTNLISKDKSDPSGLAYDGYNQSKSRNDDIVMIDTAGRLSNNESLMAELKKIIKTINKISDTAPNETILVLDGNGGQNSIMQMEKFSKDIKITGIILTKTEGSSKSGFIISLAKKYNTPIYFITDGEKISDIREFNANNFINNLLEL